MHEPSASGVAFFAQTSSIGRARETREFAFKTVTGPTGLVILGHNDAAYPLPVKG